MYNKNLLGNFTKDFCPHRKICMDDERAIQN